MRVLHLASFKGNTGDVINHMGFYDFIKDIGQDWDVTQMEIRQFYKNRNDRQFDQSFVDQVNTYDLLVIGGGNFLSPWLESSATGTTFDIDLETLSKIKSKVLFNAVGCETSLGYTQGTLASLDKLLNYANNHKEQYMFTVRNDGSYEAIKEWFQGKYDDLVIEVPDFGLYENHVDKLVAKQSSTKATIGFAVSSDRFKAKWQKEYEKKLKVYAKMVENICHLYPEMDAVFIPHTYYDLEAIYKVVDCLPDHIRRNQLTVAPLTTKDTGLNRVISYYYDCHLLIASRFHACIQAYKSGCQIISLYPDHRTKALMESIGLGFRSVNLLEEDFADQVIKQLKKADFEHNRKLLKALDNKYSNHGNLLNQWLF